MKKIFFIICLLTINILSNSREIIILLDAQCSENVNKTLDTKVIQATDSIPHGLGAITYTTLIALEQQAAPILISKSLIKNIDDHKKIFLDFSTNEYEALRKKYKKKNRFRSNTNFNLFLEQAKYIYNIYSEVNNKIKKLCKSNPIKLDAIYEKLLDDTKFSADQAVNSLRNVANNPADASMHRQMVAYIMCVTALDNESNWIIKEASKELLLLIPKKYLSQRSLSQTTAYTNSKQLTQLECSMGLKINHMNDITILQMQSSYKDRDQSKPYNLVQDLQSVFVTKQELSFFSTKPNWTIYIAGHGLPARTINKTLEQLSNLEIYYKKQKNSKFVKKQLKNIKFHIKKLTKLSKECYPFEKGLIASLEPNDWTQTIKYLDKNLDMKLLFYSSCFAGGIHLETPYKTKENKSILTHYDIICGTLSENQAQQEMPIIMIPPYTRKINGSHTITSGLIPQGIDVAKQKLAMITTLQFDKFFTAVNNNLHKNDKKLHELISYLHPYTNPDGTLKYDSIGNIASIRKASNTKFNVIEQEAKNKVVELYSSGNTTATDKQVILLNKPEIHESIILNSKANTRSPLFFSLIPAIFSHSFNFIKAVNHTFIDIVNGFLELPELKSSKIFCIKKLRCLSSNLFYPLGIEVDKPITINNVIIMRNVCTTSAISTSPKYEDEYHVNGIYVTLNGVQYKINWNENNNKQLTQDNARIEQCASKYNYKELLAHAPELTKILV